MSFIINKSSSTTVCPTLFEKTTIPNVTYLWKLINATGVPIYFICNELSSELLRYNQFVIIEKTSPNALNGECLLQLGDYDYTIYEQVSTTNLNPTGLDIVETGIITCIDSTANTNKEYAGGDVTNKVYNPS